MALTESTQPVALTGRGPGRKLVGGMRARVRNRVISLAALLPLLVVAVAGFGYDRMRCTFTGEIMAEGCCPSEDPPATPTLNGASCCDHESARTVRLPSEAPAPSAVADLSLVALPEVGVLPAPVAPSFAPRAVSHAPPPTPLVLVKQSFLI
jgi:hypothetical protein